VTEQQQEDEVVAQIEAELAHLQVTDVLLHTVSAVASLAYRRLPEENRDLEQVRLAIEALKALVPLLEDAVPEDVLRDFRQVTANLQLSYADAVAG
jgi:predicted nucleic acid-binding protein